MYRAILPDGDMQCDDYEKEEYGVILYTESDEVIAFVPYANLIAVINEEVDIGDEPAIA
ncbi:hypothetical protein [Halegenticoccus tardaugens]|uniref:hypothetical protein n=1 Tax=Halegenticoccus tardaugens TaxID=2071624 RepID=UPI0013E97A3A|nr:hypothetical protein [Halegenticoccus tardaugens]